MAAFLLWRKDYGLHNNVSAKVVQDILGHADVTLTLNTYSHVIGTTAHDQMSKIDGLFHADSTKKSQPISKTVVEQPNSKLGIKKQIERAKIEAGSFNNKPRAINIKKSMHEL